MLKKKDILQAIRSLPKAYCPTCKRQRIGVDIIAALGKCGECADDETEVKTGCRFGTPDACNHPDCRQLQLN